MSGISYLLDLVRMARRGEEFALPPAAGGTGRADGFAQGVVQTGFNVSGSTIARGTVLMQATDDQSPGVGVTPTTAAGDSVYGVALEDIAGDSAGPVARGGGPVYVLTTGAVGVGSLLYPSSTAGRAAATGSGQPFATSRGATTGTSAVWSDIATSLTETADASGETDARHQLHGVFVATYHRASDQFPMVLYSDDGLTWSDGAVVVAQVRRDPSIIHWDGKFWVVCTIGATSFLLLSSTDLSTWTTVATVTTDAGATNSWAPEWIRNIDGTPYLHPATGFPALTINISTDAETTFTVREMHPTNRGMTTWSSMTTVTGTSLPTKMIDALLLVDGDDYWLWYKQETTKRIEIAHSTTALTSGYTVFESGDWAGWFAAKDAGANSIEGPSVIRLDDGRWRIYFNENNGFNSIRAVYSETTDDWRTGTSTWTTQAAITTDALMSHGTVIFVPGVYDHQRDPEAHADIIAGIVTDHGDLTGLADDDHAQYLNAARHDLQDHSGFGFIGELLISDTPSTPLVFADLLQTEDQDDLVYADAG